MVVTRSLAAVAIPWRLGAEDGLSPIMGALLFGLDLGWSPDGSGIWFRNTHTF